MSWVISRRGALSVGLLALATSAGVVSTAQGDNFAPAAVPAPFDRWNVTVRPSGNNPQVLDVEFDSPLLRRRVTNTVFLPNCYARSGIRSPVLYALHGTVFPFLDNKLLTPALQWEKLLAVVGDGGGAKQIALSGYDTQLDRADFVVVAPDTTPGRAWCETCSWIDGRPDPIPNISPLTSETVPADSHLNHELQPLIEALFNVRTDRGGRGITGFSMGAWGSLTQAFKHPDLYSYVAAVSTGYDLLDPETRVFLDSVGYLRDQGYGTSLTEEIWWRNFNPASLQPNLRGVDERIIVSSGDACLQPSTLLSPQCVDRPAALNPAAMTVETIAYRQVDIARERLAADGIPASFYRIPGVHGENNALMYSEHVLPEANKWFAKAVGVPRTFEYLALDEQFSIWDYYFSVDRTAEKFLHLTNARTDGRAFTITGTGTISVQTPSTFRPGSRHQITGTPNNGPSRQASATADRQGRIHFAVTVDGGPASPNALLVTTGDTAQIDIV